ncbi:hypothetical protein AMTR_s00003p00068040 [Amborella trichopoda]|uniref:Uncharacterized protein n=1 Tax=Amborella trichopoda TaxID=13333 RepID=W1P605_AMBTC|nr:hypothetical protein AMTR_s00003p00068040 [Amborella trichopoda]
MICDLKIYADGSRGPRKISGHLIFTLPQGLLVLTIHGKRNRGLRGEWMLGVLVSINRLYFLALALAQPWYLQSWLEPHPALPKPKRPWFCQGKAGPITLKANKRKTIREKGWDGPNWATPIADLAKACPNLVLEPWRAWHRSKP